MKLTHADNTSIEIKQHPKHKKYYTDAEGNIYQVDKLKPLLNRNGYYRITVKDSRVITGSREYGMIARLVWESQHGKLVPDNLEINHKDKNRTNNALSNLELVTRENNIKHRDGKEYTTEAPDAF